MPSIDARITEVTQDPNGWFRISTDDPRIKRLDTKQQTLAKEAQALLVKRALARIEYSEREGKNVNPHTNSPYMDRYFDGAVELGEKPEQQALPEIPVVTPTRTPMGREDIWRICLTSGGKLAVATLPMLAVADRTFDRQKVVAAAWAEFFFFTGPPEGPSFNGSVGQFHAPAAATTGGSPGAYDQPIGRSFPGAAPPPHGDQDIPF